MARAFSRCGTTRAAALDISKAFDRVWHAVLLHKLTSYGILGQLFGHISSFSPIGSLLWFWMANLHKNVQLMLQFLKGPFLVLHFSSYILMTFLMMLSAVLLFMLMIYTALYSKCDQVSDLWQQLELASELESDLRDAACWGLLISMLGKKN